MARSILMPGDSPRNEASDWVRKSLEQQVRHIYCVCYRQLTGNSDYGKQEIPRWDGGEPDAFGTRHKAIWPRLAEFILKKGVSPLMYIRAQFHNARPDRPPRPNQLMSDRAWERWEDYRDAATKLVRRQIQSDFNQVQLILLPLIKNLGWEHARALQYALNQQSWISPLVRYILAVEHGFNTGNLKQHALMQYVLDKEVYDEELGTRIPQELRDEADDVIRALGIGGNNRG